MLGLSISAAAEEISVRALTDLRGVGAPAACVADVCCAGGLSIERPGM